MSRIFDDVILLRWRPWHHWHRKVLPPGKCRAHIQQRLSVPDL